MIAEDPPPVLPPLEEELPQPPPAPLSRRQKLGTLLYNTGYAFTVDDCFTMAAALAYFAVISALPLLMLLLALLPRIVDIVAPGFDIKVALLGFIFRTFTPEVASWMSGAIPVLQAQRGLLGGVGTLLLIWSASNVFRQLDVSIWTIWDAYDNLSETTFHQAIRNFLHGRLRSLLLILAICALFLADQAVSVVLFLFRREVLTLPSAATWEGALFTVASYIVSLFLGVLTLALLYRYLPPKRVPWRYVWPGALLAGTLNKLLGAAVSLTISGLLAGVYQAIGGPVALLLWVYFVGQSVLLGCVLSRQFYLLEQEA